MFSAQKVARKWRHTRILLHCIVRKSGSGDGVKKYALSNLWMTTYFLGKSAEIH